MEKEILLGLEEIKQQLQNHTGLFQKVIQTLQIQEQGCIDLPSDISFPLENMEALDFVESRIHEDPDAEKILVSRRTATNY